jgi:hypothetical protein
MSLQKVEERCVTYTGSVRSGAVDVSMATVDQLSFERRMPCVDLPCSLPYWVVL